MPNCAPGDASYYGKSFASTAHNAWVVALRPRARFLVKQKAYRHSGEMSVYEHSSIIRLWTIFCGSCVVAAALWLHNVCFPIINYRLIEEITLAYHKHFPLCSLNPLYVHGDGGYDAASLLPQPLQFSVVC